MKLDNYDLEILTLAHITRSVKSMDKILARGITKEHFDHKDENEEQSFTKGLFQLALGYWKSSGGSLLTSFVLESKLNEKKAKEKVRSKLLKIWADVEDMEVDDNDFHEIISTLKNKRCHHILTDMLSDINENYSDGGTDYAVKIIQENLDKIQVEKSEFGADRHNFDVFESSNFFKEEYDKRINHPELFKGINCGLSNIDSKTFGWLPGQIIVFLAPSSGGKSVMLLNSAVHANKACGKKVLYMSFEMNSWLCLLRHVSLQFEIPYSQLKDNNLSPDELKAVIDGLSNSNDGAYFEYDVNMEDPTPEYIDSRIRDLIATKGKPDLLVVDYIGNMTVRNPPNGAKDYEVQTKAVQELFRMAKRYGIPIITAQQINRETIRDARKAKESNKFMSYDQAAVSGGQVLMHLCTYAIAMEPNKEHKYCIFHPVKMRDAWFQPFPVAMDSEFNKVRELDEVEQQQILAMHALSSGATPVTTSSVNADFKATKTPLSSHKPKVEEEDKDEDELILTKDDFEDEEIDLAPWMLANAKN